MSHARVLDLIGGPLLLGVVAGLRWLETRTPLRPPAHTRPDRLITNAGLSLTAAVTFRLLVVPAALWTAGRARATGRGLLGVLPASPLVRGVLGFALLDYTTYLWHRLNHRVPFLWRFHAVHHTDLHLDVSTAFRFHAGELALSAAYRAAQVALVGAGSGLVIVYEVATQAATAFHHSNWRLSLPRERRLSRLLVTPRMHGIHHSVVERETNANWSVIFPWWDRLHGTIRLDIPQADLAIGVPAYRDARELTLARVLAMPFRRQRAWWRSPAGFHPDRSPRAPVRQLAG
jgi:sterol desaturase/sphingolipid hydroxylase (fatty acid hydroxylase superfamily)